MDDNAGMKQMVLSVRGHVQGVGYRVSARRRAAELGIDAEPVNLADGSVRVTATGTPDALAAFQEWCAEGPSDARVDSVEVEYARAIDA